MASEYKIVYQTLEDRDNLDKIEQEGPFLCGRSNAWLGTGYYFWESFIENAKWWGEKSYQEKGYVITQAHYMNDEDECYNLIDNPEHLRSFNAAIRLMEEKGLYITENTTVSRIIEFLRSINIFHYNATRAKGDNCKSLSSEFSITTIFNKKFPSIYLDSLPAIQVCFYIKEKPLDLSQYKIVFPEKYVL
ncbi:MAG: hypothetical protein EOM59_12895 [Clostridia bacterium]|nr:hypothetical protein [Clostridia bacterium]